MKRVTDFQRAKKDGRRIAMVTAYDATAAQLIAGTPIDCILVGDSAAMVVHGYDSTLHATSEMLATHTAAVRRGAPKAFIIADVPFPENRKGISAAMNCVDRLMKAGANAVKIEGAGSNCDLITHLVESGVPVMGHLGLTPQSVHQLGGYRVQGRDDKSAAKILSDAKALESAGCFAMVLECVPAELAQKVTSNLSIPTIGIGSGSHCDGQVLVWHDVLGLNESFQPSFVRPFMDGGSQVKQALVAYQTAVSDQSFPSKEESF